MGFYCFFSFVQNCDITRTHTKLFEKKTEGFHRNYKKIKSYAINKIYKNNDFCMTLFVDVVIKNKKKKEEEY